VKLQTYAIFDSKAAVFSQPYYAPNDEVAIRSFCSTAMDPSTNISRFPDDFTLHHIAEYDDELGTITPLKPRNIAIAAQFQTTKE